jgi:pilus assembly protein Flp/PilA
VVSDKKGVGGAEMGETGRWTTCLSQAAKIASSLLSNRAARPMRQQQSGLPWHPQVVGQGLDLEGLCCIWVARSAARISACARELEPRGFGTRESWRLFGRIIMKAIHSFVSKLVKDEQGGEVLEYALIAGLIVVAAIAVIGSVGGKVLARWNSLNSSM